MLIDRVTAEGIADGRVTLAFRRWDRPRMRPGRTQRTAAGVVRIETLDEVDPAALTEDDARRAGVPSLAQLQRLLDRRAGARVYRMAVRPAAIGRLDGHGRPLAPGEPANRLLWDPTSRATVDPAALASRSRNSPYAGRELPGRVVATFLRGTPTVLDGKAVQ